MKITNVKPNHEKTKKFVKNFSGKVRKVFITLDVKGKTWEEKKKIVQDKLIKTYGDIPDGVVFSKRATKDRNNPDGLRLFVLCSWIKRNRFHDNKGFFPFGSLCNAINKQVEGRTKNNILLTLENPE